MSSSGTWLRCPNRRCRRSIQVYPGQPERGYFPNGKTADNCGCCGAPMRLLEDEDGSLMLALGHWGEHEFRNRWVDIEGPPSPQIPRAPGSDPESIPKVSSDREVWSP